MSSTFVGRYWQGQGRLWKIYWLYGVLGSLILTVATATAMTFHWIGPVTFASALAVGGTYTVWILVGVWRCAFNVTSDSFGMSRDGWALLARMLTFAWAINVMAAVLFASTMLG